MNFKTSSPMHMLAVTLLLGTGSAEAVLTVQGNGTVYSDTQGISWDQDANAIKTLCDANDPLWTSFVPPSGIPLATICAGGGDLQWQDAVAWIQHINANSYKGLTNWRLWTVTQPDPSCSAQASFPGFPDQGYGYGCTGGELGFLFYAPAPNGLGNSGDACNPNCFQNTGPFQNALSDSYWSGTEFAPLTSRAWVFNTRDGNQTSLAKAPTVRYVWAVSPGPAVQSVVAVPTLGGFSLAILGLLLAGLLARLRV
ncbi:MAG: hypothetical protein P9F75_16085 [Candidatus Contendobacter sp.]|nr:hypothetical protein [Candidatus Contendobacter sp.]